MQISPPLLVYDRIAENHRKTRLLLAAFALCSIPLLVVMLPYLAEVFLIVGGIFTASVLGSLEEGGGAISEKDLLLLFGASIALAVLALVALAYLHLHLAAALVLRITGARPVGPDEELGLRRAVENLCIGAGLPPPHLNLIETQAPNMFSTGLDPEHAALVVTRGLLQLLEPRELEGVIAHELVQIGNHDTRLGTVLAAGVAMLRLPSAIAIGFFRFLLRLHPVIGWGAILYLGVPMLISIPASVVLIKALFDEGETLQAYIALALSLIYIYVFFLAPIVGQMLLRAVSRERVRLSDADAVLLTRNPGALAQALAKADAAGQLGMRANPAAAHLYFVDPRVNAPWWERLFATHPSIEERLAALSRMASFPPSELERAREAGRIFSQAHERTISASEEGTARVESGDVAEEMDQDTSEQPQSAGAFRLLDDGIAVYEEPHLSSRTIARLRSGDLIVVQAEAGEFLRVLTADDRTGFILSAATRERVAINLPKTSHAGEASNNIRDL